jgi:hypothetical protein
MTLSALGIFSAAGAGGGATGTYELIETYVLGSNNSSVVFSSLGTYASTYKHLQVRATTRVSSATTDFGGVGFRLNGDTGNNFTSHTLNGSGSTVTSESVVGFAFGLAWATVGSSAATGNYGASVMDILDAFSTTKNKTLRYLSGAGSARMRLGSSVWLNTASMTSLEINSRDGGDFVTGSRFSLYGIRG